MSNRRKVKVKTLTPFTIITVGNNEQNLVFQYSRYEQKVSEEVVSRRARNLNNNTHITNVLL